MTKARPPPRGGSRAIVGLLCFNVLQPCYRPTPKFLTTGPIPQWGVSDVRRTQSVSLAVSGYGARCQNVAKTETVLGQWVGGVIFGCCPKLRCRRFSVRRQGLDWLSCSGTYTGTSCGHSPGRVQGGKSESKRRQHAAVPPTQWGRDAPLGSGTQPRCLRSLTKQDASGRGEVVPWSRTWTQRRRFLNSRTPRRRAI